LELVFAQLDDCILAGDIHTVAAAFAELRDAAASIGLEVVLGRDKSLLVPCSGAPNPTDVNRLPSGLRVQSDGNFDFLGSPIGSESHCRAHPAKRVDKACHLLRALGELPDPSVVLLLPRHCASFGELVFSTRVVPHTYHATALREFDNAIRDSLKAFPRACFDDGDWSPASLSTKSGGLGLRHASVHCSAAFLASCQSTALLCRKLDAAMTSTWISLSHWQLLPWQILVPLFFPRTDSTPLPKDAVKKTCLAASTPKQGTTSRALPLSPTHRAVRTWSSPGPLAQELGCVLSLHPTPATTWIPCCSKSPF